MKYENIKKSLQRVSALLEDCERNGVSAVEYDMILSELRDIYSAVRFECRPGESAAELAAEPETIVVPAVAVPEPEPEICEQTEEVAEPEQTEPEPEMTEEAEEEAPAFFKSDEETQSRRRMFVRSLYSETPSATAEPQTVVSESCAEETVVVDETAEETTEEVETSEQTETDEPFTEPTETEAVAEPEEVKEEPAVAEPEPELEPESEPEPEQFEPAPEPAAEPEPVETANEPVAEEVEEHHFVTDTTEHVLGEVINADVQTFADTLHPAESAAVDFVGKSAIGSLTEAIGINDRFLLIRDLFDGNAEAFDAAVEKLNSFDNLDDCMIHIVENYEWNPYSEGAKLMMALIERRYAANRQ